jgi:hypothetical protein
MTLSCMTLCDNGDTAAAAADATVAELEAWFPAWWVWVSDTHYWWASRRDQLTSADQNAGLVPYLRAASADDLANLLTEQDQRESRDA